MYLHRIKHFQNNRANSFASIDVWYKDAKISFFVPIKATYLHRWGGPGGRGSRFFRVKLVKAEKV